MNVNELSTEVLHKDLKRIANVNNIVMKGLYPGMAFMDIKEAHEFLDEAHKKYLDEFISREDAETYEPDIRKVGTAELVNE